MIPSDEPNRPSDRPVSDEFFEHRHDIALTDAQKSKLDRRLAARKLRPDTASSWDEVKRRILGK
jgi:putative addiction module component (TIGR02574 family)